MHVTQSQCIVVPLKMVCLFMGIDCLTLTDFLTVRRSCRLCYPHILVHLMTFILAFAICSFSLFCNQSHHRPCCHPFILATTLCKIEAKMKMLVSWWWTHNFSEYVLPICTHTCATYDLETFYQEQSKQWKDLKQLKSNNYYTRIPSMLINMRTPC